MWKFLKEHFFFIQNKDEKEYIRQRVMTGDHKIISTLMIVLLVIELLMLILSFAGVDAVGDLAIENAFRFFYIFLIVVCLLCFTLINIFYKKKQAFPYFTFIAIFTFATMLWGVGISILASYSSFTLLYYSITLIACSAFICLEPWLETLCVFLSSITYVVLYYCLDGLKRTDDSIFIGGIIIVVLIVLSAFYFNFHRRISAIKLELEVSSLNKVLESKAYIDDLTQTVNRRFLTENIDKPLNYGEQKSGILMVDIDLFKKINDTYGHQTGDACLKQAGRIINSIIETKGGYCVRYGGDEFLIYIPFTNKEEVLTIAETLRKTVEQNTIAIPGGISISNTVSIGVALAHNKISYNALIDEADEALYEAKKKRNAVVIFK